MLRMMTKAAVIAAVCFVLSGLADAGEKIVVVGPEDNTGEQVIRPDESGDIEISGRVRMGELRFSEVGDVVVRFSGNQPRLLSDKSERVGLPAKVQPEVTYRDAELVFQILSRLRMNSLHAGEAPPGAALPTSRSENP